jgi:hypothetical protein
MDGRAGRMLVRKGDGATLDVEASVLRVLSMANSTRRAALGELVTAVCERSIEVAGDVLEDVELDALLTRVGVWARRAGA